MINLWPTDTTSWQPFYHQTLKVTFLTGASWACAGIERSIHSCRTFRKESHDVTRRSDSSESALVFTSGPLAAAFIPAICFTSSWQLTWSSLILFFTASALTFSAPPSQSEVDSKNNGSSNATWQTFSTLYSAWGIHAATCPIQNDCNP